jgi:transcriptional regulator with XRE-family HTH domain
MSHRDYIADRIRREPRFQAELEVAEAELAIGELLVNRWHEKNLSIAQLMELTGISQERLEAVEAGDSMTLHEVLWLLHALDVSISIDQDFHVASHSPKLLRRSVG